MSNRIINLAHKIAKEKNLPKPSNDAILNAMQKGQLDQKFNWNRNDVEKFISLLFPRDYSIKSKIPTKFKKIKKNIDMKLFKDKRTKFCEKTINKAFLLSIDSKDRNKVHFPNSNYFTINLSRNRDNNIDGMLKDYKDVKSVELVSVIIPTHTVDGDNVDDYPYLLLEIPEFGGIYDATSQSVLKSFAKLRFKDDLGAYREYRTSDLGERFLKIFDPIRRVHQVTIKLKRPDGTLYNLGTKVKRRSRYANITTPATEDCPTKTEPYYYDGISWKKVDKQPDCTIDIPPKNIEQPSCLDHLPDSDISIVLRINTIYNTLQTTHLHNDYSGRTTISNLN